jgi:hypothetical protein
VGALDRQRLFLLKSHAVLGLPLRAVRTPTLYKHGEIDMGGKYWLINQYLQYGIIPSSGDERFDLLHPKVNVWDEDDYPDITISFH